jgi:Na+/proline symporter
MNVSLVVLVFAIVGIVYAVYFSVAAKSVRTIRSTDDFFIFSRRLSGGSVFATLFAAEMSIATVFIAFFQLAPILGFQLFVAIFTFAAGQAIIWLAIPRIKAANQSRYTLAKYIGAVYGSTTIRTLVSLVSIIGFAGLFATEIVVGSKIVAALFVGKFVYFASVFAVFFIVTFYTMLGGFRNVVATDRIQTVLVLSAIILIGSVAFLIGRPVGNEPYIAPAIPGINGLSWTFVLSLFIINTLYPLVDMAAWQRIGAAESVEAGRQGFGYGIGMFLITWTIILTSAMVLSEYSTRDETGGLVASFQEFASRGIIETVIAAFGVAALAGALLSAGDTFLIAATQSFVMDISRRQMFDSQLDLDDVVRYRTLVHARQVVLAIAIFGAGLAVLLSEFGFQVADLVFVIYGSTVALFPTIATALSLNDSEAVKRLSGAATCSVVVGILGGWVYGILAIGATQNPRAAAIMEYLKLMPGSPSAYNAPIIAVLMALMSFGALAVVSRISAKR